MLKKILIACVLSAGGLLPGAAAGLDLQQQRALFLETEALLARKQETAAETNMELLRDYPLYAALRYRRLQDGLWRQGDIEAFLGEFADTRYADGLRQKWLRYLADNKQWTVFLQQYRQTDDTALQCLRRQAQHETGATAEALQAARELWADGRAQPKECDALFEALLHSPYFTEELAWRRFELALQAKNTGVAIYTQRWLSALRQPAADFWLQVHQRPALILDGSVWNKPYAQLGAIFAHGVMRMAEDDLETALAVWDQRKRQFAVDREHEDRVEKKLGMALARRKDIRAYGRLSRISSAADAAVREWTVRAALLEQNWQHVDAALQRLSAEEKPAPQWQYWQGRALQESGHAQQAAQVFKQLAQDRSFYGFLAADYAGQDYRFEDHPVPATQAEIDALRARRAFRMVEEFRALRRDSEATRQWWYAVGQLDKQGKMFAAKLAQQWQWPNIAVFTLAKADYWDDLGLRFPVLYRDEITRNAGLQGLEPALVYGLVRQESVFDPYAHSSAGARGLMQIMPATGQLIAAKLREGWSSAAGLFEPEKNLKYGAYYYRQLLDRFDGHVALAAAGYNAGPQRVARWRPDSRAVPADVWIETIPFKETRKYVSSVLMYSMIYQQRLGTAGRFKLKDLLRDVLPG